jgi:hypothetical protein
MSMLRRTIAFAALAALFLASAAPLRAHAYRPVAFDPPRGASATVNMRIPLGGRARTARPTLGLTVGYGRELGMPAADGSRPVRQIPLADFRFGGQGLSRARLATFELAQPSLEPEPDSVTLPEGEDEDDGKKKNLLTILFVGLAAALATWLLVDDGDSSENSIEEVSPIFD